MDLKAMVVAECLAKQVLQMGLQSLVSRSANPRTEAAFFRLHCCTRVTVRGVARFQKVVLPVQKVVLS